MRKEFEKQLIELVIKDKNIYFITGDLGYRNFDNFRELFPNRFINMGIREQSMIGIASGMAMGGLKPYVFSVTSFLIERAFEQVKLNVDFDNNNVKLIGFGDYQKLGITHQDTFSKQIMPLFKNIKSYFPKFSIQLKDIMKEVYNSNSPAFISLSREKAENYTLTFNEEFACLNRSYVE